MPDLLRVLILQTGRGTLLALMLAGVVSGSGCGTLKSSTRRDEVRKELDANPKYSIGGIQGPTERKLNQAKWDRQRSEMIRGADPETEAALAAFDQAQALYDAENHKEAEKQFVKLGKERRKRYESFGTRFRRTWGLDDKHAHEMYGTYGDWIEEDSLYMAAESQYAQQKYAAAQESYEDLLVRYPSTRHLDPTTRRLFAIARYWLDFPEQENEKGEIAVAGAETAENRPLVAEGRKASPLSRVPVLPNLTDKSRPLFDTYGRGEQALKAIWLHDSTGPLAADALMLAANHNLRTEDYVEARRLYALLREQYPDSQHLKDAYLLGSHVTLASYQGPAYDGTSLENAKELKQEMLALFPGLTAEERERLQSEIDVLKHAEIERTWDLVTFYRVKRDNPAAKLHCYIILNKHPDSPFADEARKMLSQIQHEEEAWANSPFNFNKKPAPPTIIPKAPEAPTQGAGKGQARLPDSQPGTQPEPAVPETPIPSEPSRPSLWQRMNPLRKAPEPPQLEQVPQDNRENPPLQQGDLAGFEKSKPTR